MPSNFTCLDAVRHTYYTCVDEATATITSSLQMSYSSTAGRVVDQDVPFINSYFLVAVVACVLVAAILMSYVKFASSSSFRHELRETLEIIVSLFTAHLSFAALLINSVWLFGQILAAVCDMLTLSPR